MDSSSAMRLFLHILITLTATNAPVSMARHKHAPIVDDKVQHYLMKFGYLPQSDLETGNLRTEEQLIEAIRTLQRFAHIKPTGIIDDETKKLLSRPRCGLPDWTSDDYPVSSFHRRKRFTLQGQTWPYTNLTWSLRTKHPENLDPGAVRRELSRALNVWEQHSKLTFQEIDSDDADILVYFWKGYHNDGYAFDGKGQILAHAFFPGTGRGGDVHFDEDENWILHDISEFDEGTSLFAVAAHEFGHSLGLSHSSVPGALMYPWYQGIKPDELPEDDRLGIQQMYGAKERKLWGNIPPQWLPPTTSTTMSTTSTTTTTTTTTTERPYHYYPHYHPNDKYPNYPYNPRKHPNHRHPYYPGNTPPKDPNKFPNTIPSDRHPNWLPPKAYPERPRPERTTKPPVRRFKPTYRPTRRKPTTTTEKTILSGGRPSDRTERPFDRYPYYPDLSTERIPTRRNRPNTKHKHVHTVLKTPPDKCNTSYDAIAVIRNEVFIFKNEYLWRIGDHGLYEGYPAEIVRMWNDLPTNLSYVDAVYERPDRKIVFFIGKLYYLYNANKVEQGYPKPLTHLGLPESLERVDAAMVWGHNGKTYLYSGTMYWSLDEKKQRVELDYPRDMSMWGGVGYNVDAVFQWKDGRTYFFKGLGFWKFNDRRMRVENDRQTLSGPFWMGCETNELKPAKIPLKKEPYISKATLIPTTFIPMPVYITISIIFFSIV